MENNIPQNAAWEETYRRQVSRVYRLCYVYLQNAADAEDAVQTVFLKLFEASIRFEDSEHEKAWLITATKNHCRDRLRAWWKRGRVDWDTLPEPVAATSDADGGEVLAKLFALPEKYRIVLYLYYVEEYPVKEIAKMLGRNESTVRSQLERARNKFREELGGDNYGATVWQ